MPLVTRTRGFTLIEMMVAVTVLAILLSIGIPTFSDVIRNNRTAATTNDLVGALNLARSEAMKRGSPVSICASNDNQSACDGNAGSWIKGWIVFSDATGAAGTIDLGVDGDVILQAAAAPQNLMQINTDVAYVQFNGSGTRLNSPGGGPAADLTFTVKNEKCTKSADINQRLINISRSGRVSLQKVGCT